MLFEFCSKSFLNSALCPLNSALSLPLPLILNKIVFICLMSFRYLCDIGIGQKTSFVCFLEFDNA